MALSAGRFSKNARLVQASNSNPSIRQGEKGDAIAMIQQAFVDLGFSMPITTGSGRRLADGIFGAETFRVVSQFQKANGLTADGIVGRLTMARLDALILAQSKAKEGSQTVTAANQFTLTTAKPVA